MRRLFLAFLLLAGPASAAGSLSGPATVIDGDTIELAGTRIDLYGIDAPEVAQLCETANGRSYPCGREAARHLSALIGDTPVTCEARPAEASGHVAAVCRAAGHDLSAWLVTQGFALARRSVSSAYVRQEARAWATRQGLWAGTFERPADWSHDHRRIEASAAPARDAAGH